MEFIREDKPSSWIHRGWLASRIQEQISNPWILQQPRLGRAGQGTLILHFL